MRLLKAFVTCFILFALPCTCSDNSSNNDISNSTNNNSSNSKDPNDLNLNTCSLPLCKNCTNSNSTCLECYPGAQLLEGLCTCPLSTGWNLNTESCEKCSPGCIDCRKNVSNCTICDSARAIDPKSGICVCGIGYYEGDPSKNQCLNCHLSCDKCIGPNENQCTQCSALSFFTPKSLDNKTGTCTCLDRYTENSNRFFLNFSANPPVLQNSCVPCTDPNCIKCYKNGQCRVCESEFNEINGACKCPTGLYKASDNTCKPCDERCEICDGINDCTVCKDYRISPVNGACRCADGSYYDITSNSCLTCHPDCRTCSGPGKDSCITCSHYKKVWNINKKKCSCNMGFYEDSEGDCRSCHHTCFSCVGPLSSQCRNCLMGAQLLPLDLNDNIGICKCKEGTFPIGGGTCSQCHYNCKTCKGPREDECLSCVDTQYVISPSGKCECPLGMYFDLAAQYCKDCPVNCKSCKTSFICEECNIGFEIHNGECKCPKNAFLDEDVGICQRCGELCSECSNDGKCLACVPTAIYDSLAKRCLCPESTSLMISSTQTCIESCPEGLKYDSTLKECKEEQCYIDNCLKCFKNKCVVCAENFYLRNNTCFSHCSPGLFWDNQQKICAPCSLECKTCSRASNSCLSCYNNRFFSPTEKKCKLPFNCPEGTFFDMVIHECIPCHENCKSCSGGDDNQCLSCKPDRIYQNETCIECQKLTGYQLNNQGVYCSAICGDGLRVNPEECDDGNTINGDGCSSICKIEAHYECRAEEPNSNKDTCYFKPQIKVIWSNDDPYNFIVEYDREMLPDNMCQLDLYFKNLKQHEYDYQIIQESNWHCLVHIDYGKNLMNEIVYVIIKNHSEVMDNNHIKVDDINDELFIQLNNYIYEKNDKDNVYMSAVFFAKILFWLIIITILLSFPIAYYCSSYLLWNLVDFIQRISLIGYIQYNLLPINVTTFFDHSNIALGLLPRQKDFDLTQHDYPFYFYKWEFTRYTWTLFVLLAIIEIINKLYIMIAKKYEWSSHRTTNFVWGNRWKIMGIITIPLYLAIFRCLFNPHDGKNAMSYALSVFSLGIHSYFLWKIYKEMVYKLDLNDQQNQTDNQRGQSNVQEQNNIQLAYMHDENLSSPHQPAYLSDNHNHQAVHPHEDNNRHRVEDSQSNEQQHEISEERLNLLLKYGQYLHEVKGKEKRGRQYHVLVYCARIAMCLLVVQGSKWFDFRTQIMAISTIELCQLFLHLSWKIILNKYLLWLTYAQHTVIIIVIVCMASFHYTPIPDKNMKISWRMEIGILISIIVVFGFNIRRFFLKMKSNSSKNYIDNIAMKWIELQEHYKTDKSKDIQFMDVLHDESMQENDNLQIIRNNNNKKNNVEPNEKIEEENKDNNNDNDNDNDSDWDSV